MVVYVTMQRLRRVCAYTQSRMSLHFSNVISMAVGEDAEKKTKTTTTKYMTLFLAERDFANCLDSDQDQQNIDRDLNPNDLTL